MRFGNPAQPIIAALIRCDEGLTLSETYLLKVPGHERSLLAQHDGFDAEIYRKQFAPYPWTHIRGFRDLFELLLLEPCYGCDDDVTEFLKGLRPQIFQRIPPQWKSFDFNNSHWTACHSAQIVRICAGHPATLDRACQAIVALQIAFEHAQNEIVRSIDIYQFIELAPAAFALKNVSDVGKAWLKGTVRSTHVEHDQQRYAKLVQDLCPEDENDQQRGRQEKARRFLSNAADGHAITFQNAQLLKSYVSGAWGTPVVVALQSRKEGGRRPATREGEARLRCNDFESEFLKLDRGKAIELQKLAERARVQAGR